MLKKRLVIVVAAAAVVASSAFGYGVEGWPNGIPDHVIKAGKDSPKVSAPAEECSCCKSVKNDCADAASCK